MPLIYLNILDDTEHAQVNITTVWLWKRNTIIEHNTAHKPFLDSSVNEPLWTTLTAPNEILQTLTAWGDSNSFCSQKEVGREINWMNKLDAERSVEPKETLIVLERAWNATWECFANGSVLEYSINFPAVCRCVSVPVCVTVPANKVLCFNAFFLFFSIYINEKQLKCFTAYERV